MVAALVEHTLTREQEDALLQGPEEVQGVGNGRRDGLLRLAPLFARRVGGRSGRDLWSRQHAFTCCAQPALNKIN